MKLTPEQRQMVEENIDLAYYALKKYRKYFERLDPEDVLSACFIGLIKAVVGFDPNRGNTFSTYAMKAMYSTIIMELIRGRKQVEPIYLEDMVNKDDDVFWQEVVPDNYSFEDEIICSMLGEQLITALDNIKMGKTYKAIIRTKYQDPELTQCEIAEKVGCRQKTVSLAYSIARQKLKPLLMTS